MGKNACYIQEIKETATPKMNQNPEKSGCDYFRCIVATKILIQRAKIRITLF